MKVPKEVLEIVKKLKENGFKANPVGGCVRDFLINKKPDDWDITTDAKPDDITEIFENYFINNEFGTVTILTESKDPATKEIEITPYRTEKEYSDSRHPDEVEWVSSIEEDLKRRDFTINAMAFDIREKQEKVTEKDVLVVDDLAIKIIDPFDGRKDLKNEIIRTVGDSQERFKEDALRLLRAVRFSAVLGFKIEEKTQKAIKEDAEWLESISKERIRDEFLKIINSEQAAEGIRKLRETGLLEYIIPEFEETYGVDQNKHHIYNVYEHLVRSLDYAAKQGYSTEVRMAALLHDIGKPQTKEGKGEEATFYNHEVESAEITEKILKRLKFSNKEIKKIKKLVRWHLFYYNVDEVGKSSVRRLVRKVGPENTDELVKLRMADRIGSGVPKARPYKLRHLEYMIEKIKQDPISTDKLEVSGHDIMEILDIKPGPKVGHFLTILLEKALEDPEINKKENLKKEIKKIGKLDDKEIKEKAEKAKEKIEEVKEKRDKMKKEKYWLK